MQRVLKPIAVPDGRAAVSSRAALVLGTLTHLRVARCGGVRRRATRALPREHRHGRRRGRAGAGVLLLARRHGAVGHLHLRPHLRVLAERLGVRCDGARQRLPLLSALLGGRLARARRLDEAALAAIHAHFYGPVFRYVAFRIPERALAEDLTSEVFMRLLSALSTRGGPAKTLRGWLFGVAAQVVNDHFRRAYREPQVPIEAAEERVGESLEAEVEARMACAALRQALRALTEDQQHVVALRFGELMPIHEVAQLIGKSEGAVKQLQARALAALARLMTKEYVDDGQSV